MVDRPGLDPAAAATPLAAATSPLSRLRSRLPVASDTVKYARMSSVMAIIFAALFVAGLALVHSAPKLSDSDATFAAFYASGSTALVTVGLYLVPFAGIAFLWHMNATRLLIRTLTPAPSAVPDGLQLVAGILFVALMFAGTGAAGGVALVKDLTDAPLPSMDVARSLLGVGYALVFVYAVRGAGMYAITTTTLLRKAGVLPLWLAVIGRLLATFLLISTTLNPVVMLLFPAWAVLVGVVVFVRAGRLGGPVQPEKRPNA